MVDYLEVTKILITVPLYTYTDEDKVRALTAEEEEEALDAIKSQDDVGGWSIGSIDTSKTNLVVGDGFAVGYKDEPTFSKSQVLEFLREYKDESLHQGLEFDRKRLSGKQMDQMFEAIVDDLTLFMGTVMEDK